MSKRDKHPLHKRLAIDVAGFGLVLLAGLTGWLPGPGGIPLFLAGLGILALNYDWAEKLLKNFDKKRQQYTEKYLMTDPKTSKIIDALALIISGLGVWVAITHDTLIIKGVGIGLAALGIVILLSNQKRLDRVLSRRKSKH